MKIMTSDLLEIISKTVRTYGDVEVRIQYPKGDGTWVNSEVEHFGVAVPIKGRPTMCLSAESEEDGRIDYSLCFKALGPRENMQDT